MRINTGYIFARILSLLSAVGAETCYDYFGNSTLKLVIGGASAAGSGEISSCCGSPDWSTSTIGLAGTRSLAMGLGVGFHLSRFSLVLQNFLLGIETV
jgi:hypothetical protein